jgi:PHP family Zn ribbon phosphoesterase
MIFDELLIRKFKSSIEALSNADIDDFLSVEDKKNLFMSAMMLYLSGE